MKQSRCLQITFLIFASVLVTFCQSSSIIDHKITLQEEKKKGSEVINAADILDDNPELVPGRYFKLLSQKIVLDKGNNKKIAGNEAWLVVDRETGVINWNRKFDRERECAGSDVCTLKVQTVMMPQSIFSLLNLEIEIEDINDNAPVFRKNNSPLNASENFQPETSINMDQYKANDYDQGVNAVVDYVLEKTKYFRLKVTRDEAGRTHLNLILKHKLDHENIQEHTLTLTATDRGTPSQSTQIPVKINVIDENDNGPIFLKDEYEVTLLENFQSGNVISQVTAKDEDSGELGEITYFFPDSEMSAPALWKEVVTLNNVTGEVQLLQNLDRERHDGLRIPIAARDGDLVHPRTGNTWLTIHVRDVNDNVPVINVNFILDAEGDRAYILETSPVRTYLAYVITTDADKGNNGQVKTTIQTMKAPGSIRTGSYNASGQFVLASEGLIGTGLPLDRESCNEYKIVITACDYGLPKKCSKKIITVVVLDANEHAPTFEATTQMVTLREDSDVGTFVTSVRAHDEDALNGPALVRTESGELLPSHYGDVTYSIVDNVNDVFSIDSNTGRISLVRKLDREDTEEWKLTVKAVDGGSPEPLSSSCFVIIQVDDVNDNAPLFVNPSVNNSHVYASITNHDVIIANIKAIDKDEKENGDIRYYLVERDGRNGNGGKTYKPAAFTIDSKTGDFAFSTEVNLTHFIGEHTVAIEARDSGDPPMRSLITIRVFVSDVPLKPMTPFTNGIDVVTAKSSDFLILALSLGSAIVFLLLVVIIVVLRCKRENKRARTYRCREAENKTTSCVACSCEGSHDDVRSNLTSPSSASSHPETTTTIADSSKVGKTWNPPNSRTESDSVLSGSGGSSTSNGSHLTTSDASARDRTRYQSSPNPSCVLPLGTKLCSPISKLGAASLSSHPDSDSGRGESETDAVSYDMHDAIESGVRAMKRSPLTMGSDEVFQREYEQRSLPYGLGPRCTRQCLKDGHSDICWMPSPEKKTAGKRNLSSIAGRTLPSTLGYSCQANQYQPKPCSRLESIRETLPAQERLSTRQFHRRNPYTKPSSCSDIPYDDERRENLSTRTRGAISSVCHHHHSSSDVYEPNFVGSSRSPSSERLSQVSSSCSAPERSLTAQEKPYNLNMNRLTSKYQDYLEVPQSNYYSRISPTSERSDRYDDNTVPTCTDSLMTANEAQEIINDINRLLV